MVVNGAIAYALLPLSIAVGGGILAGISVAQERVATAYASGCDTVREALLIAPPDSTVPRSAGEILCWQRDDSSVRESQVFTDDRGNTYLQDATGRLRVLKLEPGFATEAETGDWMSSKLVDKAEPTGSIL